MTPTHPLGRRPERCEEKKLYATFRLGELFFGIDVACVQEVNREQEMTEVPLAAPTIRGLINLRGQIVTALDLRRRIGLPPAAGDRRPMSIVVRSGEELITLLVDEIGDVLELSGAGFESVPSTLGSLEQELLTNVYKLEDRILLILDTDKAVAVTQHTEEDL